MRGLNLATLPDGLEEEIWKVLPEHSGYQISNYGRVIGPKGPINPSDNGRGYLRFSINVGGQKQSIHVHQVVCLLFNGEPPPDKPFALHNNHIKFDCRACNLHWGSGQDNVDERAEAGRNYTKLDWDKVQEIRRRWEVGESQGSLGREFHIAPQYVGKLVRHKTWKVENNGL